MEYFEKYEIVVSGINDINMEGSTEPTDDKVNK